MNIMVTGHEGFVGRYLVGMLVERGHHVYGLDIRDQNVHVSGTGPDLAHEGIATRAVANRNPDVVIHLASSVSTPGSIARPLETFRNTVRTGVNVIEACRVTGTPLILTSSVKARDGMTPYGTSKQMVEMWANEYRMAYEQRIVINRPGTIYGPGQEGSPESGWIAWFLRARAEKLPVTIYGDGSQIRDLLHVKDYCELMIRQMADFELYSEANWWDVGGGRENVVSVKEMADFLGLDYSFGPERYGDAGSYVGENICPTWEPEIHWRATETFDL